MPSLTNAIFEQSGLTETAVVAPGNCVPERTETRRGRAPTGFEMNASVTPLVSPGTRFVASERKATHEPFVVVLPSTAAPNDGPSAGPSGPRESSAASLTAHGEPVLPNEPPRRTAKTSRWPFVSPATRFEATDSKAMTLAKRRSREITGFSDAPFGVPPEVDR